MQAAAVGFIWTHGASFCHLYLRPFTTPLSFGSTFYVRNDGDDIIWCPRYLPMRAVYKNPSFFFTHTHTQHHHYNQQHRIHSASPSIAFTFWSTIFSVTTLDFRVSLCETLGLLWLVVFLHRSGNWKRKNSSGVCIWLPLLTSMSSRTLRVCL